MKKWVLWLIGISLFVVGEVQAYPPYVEQFMRDILREQIPEMPETNGKLPFRIQFVQLDPHSQLTYEILIPEPGKAKKDWPVYSTYKFVFSPGEIQPSEPPTVEVHRLKSQNQRDYLGPAIEGEVEIFFDEDGNLAGDKKTLSGVTRSLFRADSVMHPLFPDPFRQNENAEKVLTPPQKETLMGPREGRELVRPGLLDMYLEQVKADPGHPMHALLMMPTGIGKTIIILKYLEQLKAVNRGQLPTVVMVVENKGILRDFAAKIQEAFPEEKVVRLFGNSSNLAIDSDTKIIAVTRSTFFRRKNEILAHLGRQQGPKIIARDEAHHTGKVAGQFETILEEVMKAFSSDTQVIDMTATPWHEDDLRMIRRYKGRVATSFVTQEEYGQLIEGQNVDRIARIQLVRAILQGWLSPLSKLTFMTGATEDERGRTFRQKLMEEQQVLAERLGVEEGETIHSRLENLSSEDVEGIKEEIKRVHDPIVRKLYEDLQEQLLRDRNGKFAEYDRGLIFVPSIEHAEIYRNRLAEIAGDHANMEFRVVHSKQASGRVDVASDNIEWFNDKDSRSKPYRHRYLISVQILREGIDLPQVNRLVFATYSDSIKVLLQVLGRGTRIALLKSGIRLTDMGGSYLKFFKEIPGNLLRSLFRIQDPSLADQSKYRSFLSRKQKPSMEIDGEELTIARLETIEVEDTMAELSRAGQRDEARLADPSQLPTEVNDQYAVIQSNDEKMSWSVTIDPPTQEEVNSWVETTLDWQKDFSIWGEDFVYYGFEEDTILKMLIKRGAATEEEVDEFKKLKERNVTDFALEKLKEIGSSSFSNIMQNVDDIKKAQEEAVKEMAASWREERNQKEKMLNFVFANWRWMSLPWQYLLDDILVESKFFDEGHPLQGVIDFFEEPKNVELFKRKGLNTVLDAFLAGDLDFLPESLRTSLEEAMKIAGLKEQVQSRVRLLSLLSSEQGRKMILHSPHAAEIVKFVKKGWSRAPSLAMYHWAERKGLFSDRYVKRHGAGQATTPISSDFRFVLNEQRAGQIFSSIELLDPVRELREKSLQVGEPFSGIEERGPINLLRLAAMAKQMLPGQSLQAHFAQPELANDRTLGGYFNGPHIGPATGVFPVFRSEQRSYQGSRLSSLDGDQRWSYSFDQSSLDIWEAELWIDALIVEGYQEKVFSPNFTKSLVPSNFFIQRFIKGQPLPPLMLDDLLAEARPEVLQGQGIDDALRLRLLDEFRGKRISSIDLMSDSSYRMSFSGELNSVAIVQENGEVHANAAIWYDYVFRIAFNPDLQVLSREQRVKVADILDSMKISFQVGRDAFPLPDQWMNQRDLLLKAIPNGDLPFSMENKTTYHTNGLFSGNRFFMALPVLYAVTLGDDGTVFRGIGKKGNDEVREWAYFFQEKYASELEAIQFHNFVQMPEEVMSLAFRIYKGLPAGRIHTKMELKDFIEGLKDEGFSETMIKRARAIVSKTNFVKRVKAGQDYRSFKEQVYGSLFSRFFASEVRRVLSSWDILVNELAALEIDRQVQAIRNEPGELLVRRRVFEPEVQRFGNASSFYEQMPGDTRFDNYPEAVNDKAPDTIAVDSLGVARLPVDVEDRSETEKPSMNFNSGGALQCRSIF